MPVDMRLSTPRKVSHSWRILQLARQPCWSEQPAHETGPRHQTIRGQHAALMTIGGEWKLYGRRQRAGAKLQGNFTGRHACLSATKLRAMEECAVRTLSLSRRSYVLSTFQVVGGCIELKKNGMLLALTVSVTAWLVHVVQCSCCFGWRIWWVLLWLKPKRKQERRCSIIAIHAWGLFLAELA